MSFYKYNTRKRFKNVKGWKNDTMMIFEYDLVQDSLVNHKPYFFSRVKLEFMVDLTTSIWLEIEVQ